VRAKRQQIHLSSAQKIPSVVKGFGVHSRIRVKENASSLFSGFPRC
jgi:hypothetical protein